MSDPNEALQSLLNPAGLKTSLFRQPAVTPASTQQPWKPRTVEQ